MASLKKIRWAYLFLSLIPIALGVLCIVNPGLILNVICYVAGGLLLGAGLIKLVQYFSGKAPQADSLVLGALFAMLGVILIFRKDEVLDLIFIFIGVLLLLDGIVKLKNSLEAKGKGAQDWIVLLVVALIVAAFGVLIITNVLKGNVLIVILGISVIIDGLQNLYSALRGVLSVSGPKKAPKADGKVSAEYTLDGEK